MGDRCLKVTASRAHSSKFLIPGGIPSLPVPPTFLLSSPRLELSPAAPHPHSPLLVLVRLESSSTNEGPCHLDTAPRSTGASGVPSLRAVADED